MINRLNAVTVAAGFAAVGCTQQVGAPDSKAEIDPPGVGSTAQVVFEEPFSETGRFRIYREPNGEYSMSVTGEIGKDDAVSMGRAISSSFVETYQRLRRDVAVAPAELLALERQRKPVQVRPVSMISPPLEPIELPAESETYTAYMAAVCQTFCQPNGTSFQPTACNWHSAKSYLTMPANHPHGADFVVHPEYGDWSFFWNMTSSLAAHGLVTGSGEYTYAVLDHNWGYHVWPPSTPAAFPFIRTSFGAVGELGVSTHWNTTWCP
jgi:hypothetical protein